MPVELEPREFTMVRFDADELRAIVETLVVDLGLDRDAVVRVEVDERRPTGDIELASIDPVVCRVQSGALENPQRLRELNPAGSREVIGRLLLEARDRLDPEFGAPPLDAAVPMPVRVSWDTYLVGRLVRLGGRDQQARRRYHFRSRHGFTDAADAAFDRLWAAEALRYDDLVAISDASREVVG
jgi:hypothetical protein